MTSGRRLMGTIVSACLLSACSGGSGAPSDLSVPPTIVLGGPERALSGGAATVSADVANAFGQSVRGLDREQRRAFNVGNNFFNDNWVTAPASTEGRDGLGPLLNAQSCSSCHAFDGRGQPPVGADDPARGLLLRLSVPGPDGEPVPDPVYGGQLQDRAINGVEPEGTIRIELTEVTGTYADGSSYSLMAPTYSIDAPAYGPLADDVMISPRIAPAVFGVGLLEAVPAATQEALSDPDDADGDGVSGRVNMVLDADGALVPGRFGWKANVATVNEQNAGAFLGDIGITTSLHPVENCTPTEVECAAAPNGGEPEVDDDKLARVTFYTRTLAVPERRDVGTVDTDAGETLFTEIGCASCHTPTLVTGTTDITDLSDQTIHPYTDLLVHDMGPALADGRPDGQASGTEWRTAPLWGIGLVESISGHTRFLHDGRARNLTEAILWHGGEAESARASFLVLPAEDRRRLIAFLESL